VPFDDVPAVVSAALRKAMPRFQATSVQACGVDARNITVSRYQGDGYSGGNAGIYVRADGKKVSPMKD
jgi:hypothetical protein